MRNSFSGSAAIAGLAKVLPEGSCAWPFTWELASSRLAVRRTGYQALKRLACAMYYASPEVYGSVGYPGPPVELVRSVSDARGGRTP